MNSKLLLPALALVLALLACNLQGNPTTTPPGSITDTFVPPLAVTDTPAPPVPSSTPVITATNTPVAPTTAPAGLTLDMLRNGIYYTPFYNRTVTLVNGAYSEGSGSNTFSVQMLNVYALGDLNGDGKNDAAILLAENGGGSGTFESVIAVIDQGGTPHQVSQAQLGDRVLVNSVDISSGVIHLELVVQGPNDPMCCPSVAQKQNFWLIGNRLWLMRLTSTISRTEHSIDIGSPSVWSTVTNPFTVSGSVTVLPFENTLASHFYMIDGTKVNDSSLSVTPSSGTAGTFSQNYNLSSAGITDWVILQLVDVSAADGSTIALGSVILKAH